jgi:hypothetical protein
MYSRPSISHLQTPTNRLVSTDITPESSRFLLLSFKPAPVIPDPFEKQLPSPHIRRIYYVTL